MLEPEPLSHFLDLALQGTRLRRIALEHLDGDWNALAIAEQTHEDLEFVGASFLAVAELPKLTLLALEPDRGQVVEQQGTIR